MEDQHNPGVSEISNLDDSVFEKINNALLGLKNNSSDPDLIEQVIQMNSILKTLFNKVTTVSENQLKAVGTPLASGQDHVVDHSSTLDSFRKHLRAHDDHLATHDEHLATHGRYLEMLNEKVKNKG